LFQGKPLFVVANKTDTMKVQDLDDEDQGLVRDLIKSSGAELLEMSTITEQGVDEVKNRACNALLEFRVKQKLKSRRLGSVKNRLHVAKPKTSRRRAASSIPESVLRKRAAKKGGMDVDEDQTERNFDNANYHKFDGVFDYRGPDLRKQYDLKNAEWKTDVVPEIMDGKNIADYVDSDILEKLKRLEEEEEELLRRAEIEGEDEESDIDEDALELATKIRQKRAMVVNTHRVDAKNRNRSVVPKKFRVRTAADLKAHLDSLGVPSENAVESVKRGRKRGRSKSRNRMDVDDEDDSVSKRTRSRSRSVKPPQQIGLKNERARKKVKKMINRSQRKRNQQQRKGPGDRTILNLMPKHLYSGKRGIGSTDRR
jgi:nucleolar GTP-binding protein